MVTEKRKIGDVGENILVKHLMKHKYKILDKNYRKNWGEIDVVASKDETIHFFEVKTIRMLGGRVSGETHDPEDNVHVWKRKRMSRVIQSYLEEKRVPEEIEWQGDVAAIFLDFTLKEAKIRITEDINLN